MIVKDIISAIERVAPLRLQDEWDNSGLQVGFPGADVRKVLVCLDVTEAVVEEAAAKGCGLIVSHHPLLFHSLKQVSDATYQQRCVYKALKEGIAIYSAHTSLDNASGGVNFEIAGRIGLLDLEWLQPKDGEDAGSGLVGILPEPETDKEFLARIKDTFLVECLRHSECSGKPIHKVALCGGAGAFLMRDAVRAGADCFISGEFHYHDYFENDGMLLAELGHYQSEQYTVDLLCSILEGAFPGLAIIPTDINTNPIQYDDLR
ncbi:MAG: Nif3-like dinuclear metal center hexameric protein [Bacteroidales bacterium]|nr:Nif3-like dinuclear metal center hexameric protein [Bacteroidales bacterium]